MTIPRAEREAVFQASMAGKEVFIAAAVGAGLTPGKKMHGVGRRGASWGAGFKLVGQQTPTSVLSYRGPVHLVNGPTKAHTIAPKKQKVRAVPRGDGSFAASVNHPGTSGKHFAEGAKRQVEAQTPKILAAAMRRALIQNFGK